jgi:polyisoprenoid-binding protein YceI
MSRTRVLLAIVVLGAVAGAGGLWYLFFRSSGPPPVALATANPSAASTSTVDASSTPGTTANSGSSAPSTGIDGPWTVDTTSGSFSDYSDSFLGDRVQEELASVGAQTAVGRTPNVSGTMTISGTSVTAVQIQADLTALKSDDDRRDGQLQRQALETSQFPTATFTLTEPIDLGDVPTDGQTVHVTATGQLTLHGQTRTVQIPLDARIDNGVISVTGSIEIQFADYGIAKPQSFLVLSVADHGTMELQLFFTRS